MQSTVTKTSTLLGASLAVMAIAAPACAQETAADPAAGNDGMIVVTGARTTYNNSVTTRAMADQQTPLTSPLAQIDNLPGVSVQEGDTFGFDDWSTTVSLRGFQTNLDEQQVGITVDGLPNGGSNYGGGSKANRFIDTMNIGSVAVSQGTADIGSLSNEALGGTLDFRTDDPLRDPRARFSVSLGEFDAQRFYARYDTGDILGGLARLWVSASHQEATDHITGTAENERDHFALKFVTNGPLQVTGYASYDDTHEDNYQRLFSLADFASDPDNDQLTGEWTQVPYIDQLYRQAWSTLRENAFGYLRADGTLGSDIDVSVAGYYHYNSGRGDWVPPYLVNVTADGDGNPESEFTNPTSTVRGGSPLGRIYFVDPTGIALSPRAGCVSSITFPYGGAGPESDPACYPAGSLGVQSYRHTHYQKDRYGVTADASWAMEFGAFDNVLRGGVWYEDGERKEFRDWHRVVDTRIGPDFFSPAYWLQYDRAYPQSTFKWFVEDQLDFGPVSVTAGVKQFHNELERNDVLGVEDNAVINSTSDLLFSGGIQFDPIPEVNIYVGYAENYKALSDAVLERPEADIGDLEPETADNWEAGVRFNNGRIQASAAYFSSTFNNRVVFFAPNSDAGPDYLIGDNGTFFNVGGLESEGFELLLNAEITTGLTAFSTFTYVDARYLGAGDAEADALIGLEPGNRVTGIAENLFVLGLDYNNGPVRAGVSGKYTGDRFVDVANTFVAEGYTTLDAYFGVNGAELNEALTGLDFSLVINNLTDEDFLGGISGGGAWVGPPRTVVFTLTADF